MPDLLPWPIGLALAVLVRFLYWAEWQYPTVADTLGFAAWELEGNPERAGGQW
jgi:hypothetical protein